MCPDRIRYIENKSVRGDSGPAWIARVKYSGSKKTIYFYGMALKSIGGRRVSGNYCDMESGDEYWVSGVKVKEWNRHPCGSGKIMIESSLVPWYKQYVDFSDLSFLQVIDDIPETDIAQFHNHENEKQ